MIAHIRQSKQQETPAPIVRARHMVAETLLPDQSSRRRRWPGLQKGLFLGGAVLLALAAGLACFLLR